MVAILPYRLYLWLLTPELTALYGVLLALSERVIVRLFSALLGNPSAL